MFECRHSLSPRSHCSNFVLVEIITHADSHLVPIFILQNILTRHQKPKQDITIDRQHGKQTSRPPRTRHDVGHTAAQAGTRCEEMHGQRFGKRSSHGDAPTRAEELPHMSSSPRHQRLLARASCSPWSWDLNLTQTLTRRMLPQRVRGSLEKNNSCLLLPNPEGRGAQKS